MGWYRVKRRIIQSLILLIVPTLLQAKPVPVRVTNTTVTEYRTNNQNGESDDDDYGSVVNRLNISGTADNITTAVRVDTMGFFGNTQTWHHDDLRLEQLKVQYNLGDWQLNAGDFYRQLGRGIVLSLRKMDEAGRDISLRGGEVVYGSKTQSAGIFGGRTNVVNLDILKQRFVDDPNDILAGAWYTLRQVPLGSAKGQLGIHSLINESASVEPGTQTKNATQNVGGTFEIPDLNGWGSIYLEGDFQQRRRRDVLYEGRAFYGSLDIFFTEDTTLSSWKAFCWTSLAKMGP